jgi:hypothetical protein
VQKKSSDRYHRIEQLADDVEAWIGFDPVSVHNDNAKDWFVRSFSRYDTLARIAVIGSTLFLASLIAAIWLLTLANNSQRIAKKNGLLFAAGVASDRVADEFRFRLDALEDLSKEIADSKELSACMQPTESTGDWQDSQIHGWLQKRIEGDLSFPIHASVFVLSRGGIQIAKHSGHENCNGVLGSLGKNFSHRSYFASNSEGSNGSIIDAPHLSRWYLSSTSKNKIRIALSCPVKNENDKILGVVGLSLNLDDLSFVRRRLVSGQQFSIVDLRPGESKTKPNIGNSPGLIAYHPGYQLKIQSEGVLQEFQFIGSQQVGDMLDVRSRRLNQFANTDSHQPLGLLDNFVSSYSDSVTGANEQKMAYEPIIVRHGDGWIDSGLVVLVQEE